MTSRDHINQIALVPGTGPMAPLVRWATQGPFAHAAYVSEAGIFEADIHEGLILTAYDDFDLENPGAVYTDWDVSKLDPDAALTFAYSQLGAPYDWTDDVVIGLAEILNGFMRVPTPLLRHIERALEDDRKWNCSAFATAVAMHLGVEIFSDRLPTHAVSPNDIYRQMLRGDIPSTLSPVVLREAEIAFESDRVWAAALAQAKIDGTVRVHGKARF